MCDAFTPACDSVLGTVLFVFSQGLFFLSFLCVDFVKFFLALFIEGHHNDEPDLGETL